MTSSEKIAELRRVLAAAAIAPDADPQLAMLFGAVRFVPGFVRRRVMELLPNVDDPDELDALLGLIAGAALELRSDVDLEAAGLGDANPIMLAGDEALECREAARVLLDRIFEPDALEL